MTIQEVIKKSLKSGKWFKLPEMPCWLKAKRDNEGSVQVAYATDNNFKKFTFLISLDDILREDWQIKEEWYEGDFKKKYPNGVWCKVWDDIDSDVKYYRVVTDYIKNLPFPFATHLGSYTYAEPTKEKAPAIIEED